jgi:hypothetical protein
MEWMLKARILNMYADFHNHIKDLKVDILADAANEDYVVALARVTGTATDAMMGGAGTKIDEKGVDVTRYKDGKMAEHWVCNQGKYALMLQDFF